MTCGECIHFTVAPGVAPDANISGFDPASVTGFDDTDEGKAAKLEALAALEEAKASAIAELPSVGTCNRHPVRVPTAAETIKCGEFEAGQ